MTAPLIDASLATGMDTVRAIHASDLRAEDALAACIERITATEARVNAFTDATFARAMREAQVIDARRARMATPCRRSPACRMR